MAKPILRVGSRKNGRISSRKTGRTIPKGVIHVQASFNNTIITVTDIRGRVVSWSSVGTSGNTIRTIVDQGMQRAKVMIKGPGLGRDATLRAIRRSGILLSFVRDVTLMPHNGCRPPKKYVCRNKNGTDFKSKKMVEDHEISLVEDTWGDCKND
ncbi:hypothetical protein MKX03_033722 [Papaver bracteatum]|nr:hypothetical protein MKX03_033722 [Papaver bracteatum]